MKHFLHRLLRRHEWHRFLLVDFRGETRQWWILWDTRPERFPRGTFFDGYQCGRCGEPGYRVPA